MDNNIVLDYKNKFEIPDIKPVYDIPDSQLIGFNYVKTCKEKTGKAVHFYLDDYQFERCYNMPEKIVNRLKGFDFVLSPDFSVYTDNPIPIQLYQCYKKNWCAAYWQKNGIVVIPTVCWGDEKTYDFCFAGIPEKSIVSVSSVGTMRYYHTKKLFLEGYQKMMEALEPSKVIFYGKVPDEIKGNSEIKQVDQYCEKFRR